MNKTRGCPNCRAIICSKCGSLNLNLEGAKALKCPQCNQKSDKDFNTDKDFLLNTTSLGFRDSIIYIKFIS